MSQKIPNLSSRGSSSAGKTPPPLPRNRFQKSGTEAVYEVTETKEACVMRADLPGCPESDLVHWIDGSNIHFFADEPAMPEYNHAGRKYGGTWVLNPEMYNVKDAKVKLINGVLWATIPKIPGKKANVHTVEQIIYLSI